MTGWFGLVVASLATWRLCHLVAFEDGPFDAIARLREKLGDRLFGRLMDCPYCLSLWFALPFAAAITSTVREFVMMWLAVSGVSCLIEHAAARLRAGATVLDFPAASNAAERGE